MSGQESAVPERIVPGTLDWDVFYYEHQQRYDFAGLRVKDLRVLDAACGVGYGSAILADAGAQSVTGVDVSEEAIAYARTHFGGPRTSYVTGDVKAMPFEANSFDLAVSFETLEHVPHPAVFLAEVARVLKPGGVFVCSTPNRDWEGRSDNPFHLSEMSLSEFEKAFKDRFTLEERYFQSHSPAYLRHMDMVRELGRLEKPLRFSWSLRLENWIRGRIRKEQWEMDRPPTPELARAVPGDFVIEPLVHVTKTQLTYIFVGRALE